MHPILLDLGFFSIKTYGFLIATGFLIGILIAKNEAKRLNVDTQVILDLAFYIALFRAFKRMGKVLRARRKEKEESLRTDEEIFDLIASSLQVRGEEP